MSETALLYDPSRDFELKKVLGRGSFGAVYYALRKPGMEEVAVKRLEVSDQKALDSVLAEIDVMKGIDNDHLVKYFNNYYWKKEIWISMEYCSMGSLSNVLDKCAKTSPPRGFRDEYHIQSVTYGILIGLVYMHKKGVVHRDIKSDNVLLDKKGVVKIADFGISRRLAENERVMHTMIGTPHYLAPEVVTAEDDGGYTAKVDVWALGIICVEMADGRPPYADLNPMKVLFELANNPRVGLKDPSRWSEMYVNFTEFCLKANPAQRPSTDHMIRHPWLKNVEPVLDLSSSRKGSSSNNNGRGGGDFASFQQSLAGMNLAVDGGGNGGGGGGGGRRDSNLPAAEVGNDAARRRAERKQAIQYFNKGIALDSQKQHDEAIEMYNKALALDPTHLGSYTNRGVSWVNKKEYDRAIADFSKACELNPKDANNFVNVGVAYANKKNYRKALDAFAQALRINPNHKVAISMQRRCEMDQRKLEQMQGGRKNASSAAPQPIFGSGGGDAHADDSDGGQLPPPPDASTVDDFWRVRQHFDRTKPEVPPCVAACVQFLEQPDEVTNVNIFQEPGDTATIQKAKNAFDTGNRNVDIGRVGSHNVAGLLWLWMHDLYEPLGTYELYGCFLDAIAIVLDSGGYDAAPLAMVIAELPAGNRAVLYCLLGLLAKIHNYQGNAAKLGAFFAPVLLRSPDTAQKRKVDPRAKKVVEYCIVHMQECFQPNAAAMAPNVQDERFQRLRQRTKNASVRLENNVMYEQQLLEQTRKQEAMQPNPFGYSEQGIVFRNVTREEAEDQLGISLPGSYLIRPSSQAGCLSCSYRALDTGRIGHLLLQKPNATISGWTTDGRPRPYPTIRALLKSLPYGLKLD